MTGNAAGDLAGHLTTADEFDGSPNLADRVDGLLVLAVLVVDVVLLALLELMFVTLSVGATPLPVSSLVALLSTPWLVRRAGELPTGVLGAASVYGGWVATVGVLGLGGPGGDLLLPDGWPSLLLLGAGLVPGAWALGRVIRDRRSS
ncbi:MAG: hypothetical protein ACT4O0_03625 [Pseudonocardia sp.]